MVVYRRDYDDQLIRNLIQYFPNEVIEVILSFSPAVRKVAKIARVQMQVSTLH
jgi:hypothetical protein